MATTTMAEFFCNAIEKSLLLCWSNGITKIDDIAESKYFHFTFELEFHQKCNTAKRETQRNVALLFLTNIDRIQDKSNPTIQHTTYTHKLLRKNDIVRKRVILDEK